MIKKSDPYHRLSPVGDSALLLELGESLDPEINARVLGLDLWLKQSPFQGIKTWVPGYASLLVIYDPLEIAFPDVAYWMEGCLHSCPKAELCSPKQVEVPVRYGGADGPDLVHVAECHGISPSDVVRMHSSHTYRVGMMGFTPGFAYLMGLDPNLATPRLATPRTQVPAGSVGIAGGQTGIYPSESPGGWQLIGRTDCVLFDPAKEPHFMLSPGDEVRFMALDESRVR